MQEDDDAIRSTLQKAGVNPTDIGLSVVNKARVEAEGSTGLLSSCPTLAVEETDELTNFSRRTTQVLPV